jgi:hypothetical protein
MSLRAGRLPLAEGLGALHGLPAAALRFLHHHRRGQFIVFLAAGSGGLAAPGFW